MIGVLGAGAFGTALAVSWTRAGRDVILWGRDGPAMQMADRSRSMARLPGVTLPDDLTVTAEIAALGPCETLVLAVPAQTLPEVMPGIADLPARRIVAACKGMNLTTLKGPTATVLATCPGVSSAILSGPSFATDIAAGLPTALSLGCVGDSIGARLQAELSTPAIRLYRTTDVAGVELGGALKNVIAIACGAAIGAGLGESARAALMTRGMAEMMRLATALGAERKTLMGLSGLGDLALTCASPQSRNFALGQALGAGKPPQAVTTEGVATAQAALNLAAQHDISLPVTQVTAALVAGEMSVKDAMRGLLDRDLTTE